MGIVISVMESRPDTIFRKDKHRAGRESRIYTIGDQRNHGDDHADRNRQDKQDEHRCKYSTYHLRPLLSFNRVAGFRIVKLMLKKPDHMKR